MIDLAILNGNVYYNGSLRNVDLGISEGKIVAITSPGSLPNAREIWDAKYFWVLPGFIDSHVHMRYPAQTDYEDLVTGTQAAAAGGVTTFIEMPVSLPSVCNGDILKRRADLFEKETLVDFALLAAPGKGQDLDTASNVMSSYQAGAAGYKIFMTPGASKGREDQFKGLPQENDADIYAAFTEVAKTGLPCVVHCEDPVFLDYFSKKVTKETPNPPPSAHTRMRPKFLEIYAVKKAIAIAEETHAHIHLAHMSTPEAIELVVEARERGYTKVTCETCPHYLALDSKALDKYGPYAKINPPLRENEDVEGLWMHLKKGHIDAVATDHCNFSPEAKEPGWKNILHASSGAPGIEVMAPLILSSVLEGRLSLPRAMDVLARNPAQIFAIHGKKGEINVGADGDLVFLDPKGSWNVGASKFFTKHAGGMRLWSDFIFQGKIIGTIVRGQKVYWKGESVGMVGTGRFVSPVRKGE
ncbi:MAG: amidohydrolase family protein [Thermodesulfobacteriota bacterium]|jgi:allantoinase